MRIPKELPTEGAVAGADDNGPAGDDPAAPVVKRAVQWVGALRFYHGGGADRKGAA